MIGHETWEECRKRSEQTLGGQLCWCGNCELTHQRLGLPCEEHTRWEERAERLRLFDERWPAYVKATTKPEPSDLHAMQPHGVQADYRR